MLQTIEHKLEEQSRVLMAWVRGAVYTTEKQADLVWLLRAVLETLELASQQGELFAFVPDFYLETMVELCSALRCYFSPTLPLEELAGKKNSVFINNTGTRSETGRFLKTLKVPVITIHLTFLSKCNLYQWKQMM